jgi:hypothetical protein
MQLLELLECNTNQNIIRAYKRNNSRARNDVRYKETFFHWSNEAREKRSQCLAGEITLDEFEAWLDKDRKYKK